MVKFAFVCVNNRAFGQEVAYGSYYSDDFFASTGGY